MKITILIQVPGEPIAQSRPRFRVHKNFVKVYDAKPIQEYKKEVAAVAKSCYGLPPIQGAVRLQLDVFRGMPKSFSKRQKQLAVNKEFLPITKPDTDNYVKGVKDALTGICYVDDAQVVDEHVRKFYSDAPRVEITIEEV